jgi:hypothetical protein
MGRRKLNCKRSAAANGPVLGLYRSTVFKNNSVAQRETHAGTLSDFFRCEERVEYFVQVLGVYAWPGVGNHH